MDILAGKMQRRYAWIELSLRVTQSFNIAQKKAYRDRFALTEGMVSRDQDAFVRIVNDGSGSRLIVKHSGRLRIAKGTTLPEELFFPPLPKMAEWLEDTLGSHFEMVPPILRVEPPHHILGQIIKAIVAKRLIQFLYQPRGSTQQTRLVSPHVIVHIAGRLHLRGWDHRRNEPRDFVLTRIVSVSQLETLQGFVGQGHDYDWSKYAKLELILRAGEHLNAARPDYGLDEFGHGVKQVREAFVKYFFDENEKISDDVLKAPVTVRRLEN